MRRSIVPRVLVAVCVAVISAEARQAPAPGAAATQPFMAGPPLKLTPNARTYGGFRFSESLSYDAERDVYVAINAGMPQDVSFQ